MNAGISDVPDGYSRIGVALFDLEKALGRAQIGCGTDAHIFRADLFQKKKLFVTRFSRRLRAQFDAGGVWMHVGQSVGRLRLEQRGRSERELSELPAVWIMRKHVEQSIFPRLLR